MTIPVRHLPVMQNWDCHGCSDCCRIEAVVTAEEKRRIEALDLAGDAQVAPGPWFTPAGRGSSRWTLKHRPEGGCVFLTAGNRCRIQERFGAAAKPFVCRLFPFVLIPAGSHWRVGLRFSCPSAATNSGRPITESEGDLARLTRQLETHVGRRGESATPPPLKVGQDLPWPEVCRVVEVLVEIVQDRGHRLEWRMRLCLALARQCGQTQLDGLRGEKLSKYLRAVRSALEADVPRDPSNLPPPDRLLGGVLFRALLAIFACRDRDSYRATAVRRRLGRVVDGLRFVRGRGRVPRVNEFLPDVGFEDVEQPAGLPPELDEILERYYAVKLNSLQFCGPSNFGLPLWAGLESLILTLPMILWLSRALKDEAPAVSVEKAIQLVDDHFGGDPMLGFPHIQYLVRTLALRGELEKLVGLYGR